MGEVWEQEDSGGYYVSLMRKMIVTQSRGGVEMERSKGLGFICRWNSQDLLCTDSGGEGKKKIKDDSWVIWLTTWVAMLHFLGEAHIGGGE